jgi:hypothetical protein
MGILGRNGNGHTQSQLWDASQLVLAVLAAVWEIEGLVANPFAPVSFQGVAEDRKTARLRTVGPISKASCSFSKAS